jgi:hypothetical protein
MKKTAIVLVTASLLFSCQKKENKVELLPAVYSSLEIKLDYTVDNAALLNGQMNYTTAAGYNYSVTKLVYYLSRVSLVKQDNSKIEIGEYQFCDAFDPSLNRLYFRHIPAGDYKAIVFNIGLDSSLNISNRLPATTENINMQWPDPMGGGYHFLMLEGYFTDSTGTNGYAVHLGTNKPLINIMLDKSLHFEENSHLSFNLVMNVNEWFRTPDVYDFVKDGNYTMGNQTTMMKIARNGKDVFSISP